MITKNWNRIIFSPVETSKFLETATSEKIEIINTNKKASFYNIPCVLDLECSSFYEDGEKRGIMYAWILGINGVTMLGRTWKELLETLEAVQKFFDLDKMRRLIIYVHNLAYDFQFFRKWIHWEKIFAIDERKPAYAISDMGIEFRCSYILSGYSLETIGKNLQKYHVEKLKGDLDYNLIRHSKTPLTAKETAYIEHDALVVMAYIQERIEEDGNITHIPLTKTGYVRRYIKNACLYGGMRGHHKNALAFYEYKQLMRRLTLTPEEYLMARRSFAGGFTHASAWYSGILCEDVFSEDETSAYPAMMCAKKFPMSKGERITKQTQEVFERNILLYCCVFDVTFYDIEERVNWEHIISVSKCYEKSPDLVSDNGRVVSASKITLTITNVDFLAYRKFYRWKKMRVGVMYRYQRDYLPKPIVASVLDLYGKKTTLKGVEGAEIEYMGSKEKVNSSFGMMVTDILQDMQIYSNENGWEEPQKPELEKAIEKENNKIDRFLFYLWGVFITAFNRYRLWMAILELKDDYIYSDTDSAKGKHMEKHSNWFRQDSDKIKQELLKAMDHHGLPRDLISPKTIKGEEKTLGVWEYEHNGVNYTRFKTLGAKRYMTEINGEISLTVSGVNKENAIPYLLAEYGKDGIFSAFSNDLEIPASNKKHPGITTSKGIAIDVPTGKMTHTYLDFEYQGKVKDYLGKTATYYEKSAIHLEGCAYNMSLSDAYLDYLLGIREYEK